MEKKIKIIDPLGMHARPSSLVVKSASSQTHDVFIEKDGNKVSLKSILGIMSLGVKTNDEITVISEDENSLNNVLKTFKDEKLI